MTPLKDIERLDLPSASGMDRLINCPGSKALCAKCPPLPENAVSAQGTSIAQGMETGDFSELDETSAEIAERLKALEADARLQWYGEIGATDVPQILREERLWIRDRKTLQPIASAKPDAVYIANDSALDINHKTGFLDPTPSEISWQLRTEALAIWHENPQIKRVRAVFAHHRFRSKLDTVNYTLTDLQHSERDLLFAFWRAEQPDAPRVPGVWCRYCPAANGHCAEATTFAVVIAHQTAVAPMDKKGVTAYVDELTTPQLAFIHSRSSVLVAILEGVRHRLRDMTPTELAAVGLRLRPTSRTYISDQNAARELLAHLGLTERQLTYASTLSKSTLAELLQVMRGGTMKSNVEAIKTTLAPVLVEKSNEPSIVPI